MYAPHLRKIYILSFLFSLHLAISAYVNSSFLAGVVGEQYVGLLYTLAAASTLLLFSNTRVILKYFGNKKFTFILLLINIIALLGMIYGTGPMVIGGAFILFITTNNLVYYCLDIFIEQFGTAENIGKIRGLYLTIINVAWVMSPLITSYLIKNAGGYIAIYIMALIAVSIMLIGMATGIGDFKDKSYTKKPFLETYRFLKNNHHIRAIAIINFLLQFFFAWMVVYTPIYLHKHIGLPWDSMGIIFTAMLLPFVLFGLPVGKLIDTYHVHKRTLLTIGTIIISGATIAMSFFTQQNIWVWAFILFMTRVGATLLETVGEIYFFTHVKEEDSYLLSIYRDMTPLGYIIAPLLGTLFLTFFPFKYLFLTLGMLMLATLYYISRLKHNHELTISSENK